MKIAIGEFGQETNSFAPGPCSFERFSPTGWFEPDTLLARFEGSGSYLGGMIKAAREEQVELIPLPSLKISAGPTLAGDMFRDVTEHICAHLNTVKDQIDGICFAIHGAGCAEGVDDLESATIRALRSVVGDRLPITCSADLHANHSDELLGLVQGIFGLKENPHVDSDTAGYCAMKALISILRGEIKPRMHLCRLPLLITPATGNTYNFPMKDIKEYFAAYCKRHGLLDATFFHGFSAADIPDSSASVLVVADGYDPEEHALTLARYVWSMREHFIPRSLTPNQAIDLALASVKDRYVVINEISDNVGSGCPGDGTHTLRAMLERDVPNSIFNYMYDPEVALQAHEAGVGAVISIRLGGKTDTMSGDPIELDNVEVVALPEQEGYTYLSPMNQGLWCALGKTARLRHGNVEFIVVSTRKQTLDDGAITLTGANANDYRLIALKSANHFRGYFTDRADAIVTSDPPGLRCSDLRTYPYRRILRPKFPLDPDVTFS